MAIEYVILTNSDKGNLISGFAHSVVPAGNNVPGTPWSQALTEYLATTINGTVSQVPSSVLPGGRQVELDNGTKYEWPFRVGVNANDTDGAKEATVEAALVAEEAEIIVELQNRLRFWGRTGVTS